MTDLRWSWINWDLILLWKLDMIEMKMELEREGTGFNSGMNALELESSSGLEYSWLYTY